MSRTSSAVTPAQKAAPAEPPAPVRTPDLSRFEDQALLELLLRRSSDDPERLAARLIAGFGSLGAVVGADAAELARQAPGGHDALLDLQVSRELAIRMARQEASRLPVIGSWSALEAYVRADLAHRPREEFRVLYLDNRNRLLRDELRAEGTVDHAPVYPREVVRRALELCATALVLVHNHPSGDPTPSQADIAMTRRIVEAAAALDLKVHDHLIVARQATASFRALGLM